MTPGAGRLKYTRDPISEESALREKTNDFRNFSEKKSTTMGKKSPPLF